MQGQSLASYAVFRNSFQCYVIFREHVRGRPLKHSACCCTWSHTCQHMVTVSWSHVNCPLSHVWVWVCLLRWLDFQLIIHFTYDYCVHVCEYHVSVHATAHTWRSNIPQHTCGGPTCHIHVEVQEQLYGMRSLLPLLCGSQELKSGHQAGTISVLTSSAILLAWLFFYLLLILWKHKHT